MEKLAQTGHAGDSVFNGAEFPIVSPERSGRLSLVLQVPSRLAPRARWRPQFRGLLDWFSSSRPLRPFLERRLTLRVRRRNTAPVSVRLRVVESRSRRYVCKKYLNFCRLLVERVAGAVSSQVASVQCFCKTCQSCLDNRDTLWRQTYPDSPLIGRIGAAFYHAIVMKGLLQS